MRWTTWGMVMALVLVLVPAREASAQPAPEAPKLIRFAAELQVDLGPGTERCPDAVPYLRKQVADEMEYDPFAPGATWRAAGTFAVKVSRVPSGIEAVTTFVDAESVTQWTRPYRDRTTTRGACESVLKGAALQIVTELTRFADEVPASQPPPAPACPAASSPCPACPVSRFSVWPTEWPMKPLPAPAYDPPKPERAPLSFRFGSGVWVDRISDAEGSLGLTLDASVRYLWGSVGVEVRGDPSIGPVTSTSGARVGFARVTGALLLCGHMDPLVACVKGQLGGMLFPGSVPSQPPQLYAAVGVRLGLEFRIVPSHFILHVDGELLPTIAPASIGTGSQTVFQVVGLNAGLGLGAMFSLDKR